MRLNSATNQYDGTAQLAASPRLSLRVGAAWSVVSHVTLALSQASLLLVIALMGNAEYVGQFAFGLAFVTPAISFSQLGLYGIHASDAEIKYSLSEFLGIRLVTSALAVVVIVCAAIATQKEMEMIFIIFGMLSIKVSETLSETIHAEFQRMERADWIAKAVLIRSVLSPMVTAIMLFLNQTLFTALVAMLVVKVAILLVFELPKIGKDATPTMLFSGNTLSLLHLGIPLGMVAVLAALTTYSPSYFLAHTHGVVVVGQFAIIGNLSRGVSVLARSLQRIALPRFGQQYRKRPKGFVKTMLISVFLAVGIGILSLAVSAVIGRPYLNMFDCAPSLTTYYALLWMMIAGTFAICRMFLRAGLTVMHVTYRQLMLSVIDLFCAGTLGLLLIPRYGLIGAAWSISGTLLLSCLFSAAMVTNHLSRELHAT